MAHATCADPSIGGRPSQALLRRANRYRTPGAGGLYKTSTAFKVFFMATLRASLGPLVRLLAAMGALSSLLLLGLLNLFS